MPYVSISDPVETLKQLMVQYQSQSQNLEKGSEERIVFETLTASFTKAIELLEQGVVMKHNLDGPEKAAAQLVADLAVIRDATPRGSELWKLYDNCMKAYAAALASLEALKQYFEKGG